MPAPILVFLVLAVSQVIAAHLESLAILDGLEYLAIPEKMESVDIVVL